jgi:hypothetical protein
MGSNKTDVDVTKEAAPAVAATPERKVTFPMPSVGRIVLYVPVDNPSASYAADVARAYPDSTVMLFVKDPELRSVQVHDHVPQDENGTPGTFHWPMRA